MVAWWRRENPASSIVWIGLCLPGLMCCLPSLLRYLNRYPKVDGSTIIRLIPERLDGIVPLDARVEVVADGFDFTEGPLWVHEKDADRQYLLFSDIPDNRIWKWEGGGGGMFASGASLFLDYSGCRGDHCSALQFPGSNGLEQASGSGEVVICEHGDRRVTRMEKNGTRTPLATHFNGNRLNSPNDLAFSKRGDLYFTDPPWGLPKRDEDPGFTAHGFGGVYRVRRENIEAARAGESQAAADPELLDSDFAWPNGLAFSPDFSRLYMSVVPPPDFPEEKAWYVYDVGEDGDLANRRMFFDPNPLMKVFEVGVPDGLAVDDQGNVFVASPGGVSVISPAGKHLGMVFTGGMFVSNVVLAGDGYLYMTATKNIIRVKVLTKPAPHPAVDA